MPRHVARNNRVVGGMLITAVRRKTYDDCTSRFQQLGAPCYHSDTTAEPYGNDVVGGPALHRLLPR